MENLSIRFFCHEPGLATLRQSQASLNKKHCPWWIYVERLPKFSCDPGIQISEIKIWRSFETNLHATFDPQQRDRPTQGDRQEPVGRVRGRHRHRRQLGQAGQVWLFGLHPEWKPPRSSPKSPEDSAKTLSVTLTLRFAKSWSAGSPPLWK